MANPKRSGNRGKRGKGDPPATPDEHIKELKSKQKRDKKRIRQLEKRVEERRDDLDRWRREDEQVDRAHRHHVRAPWLVFVEADLAEAEVGGLNVNMRALALAILERETGIPQRDVYGCDHGAQGGQRPYCGDEVTKANAGPFIRWVLEDPFAGRMNGQHWTQTTWYTKLERVLRLGEPWRPRSHLRVCLSDLAVLVEAYGLQGGAQRYNGSGPHAEEYGRDIANNRYPRFRELLTR